MHYLTNHEKVNWILSDPKRKHAALFLINHFMINLQNEQNCELFIQLVDNYANYQTIKIYNINASIYNELFKILNKFNRNEQGYIFFSRISQNVDNTKFYTTKSFAIYFAYQLKQYDQVQNILNSFFIQLQSDTYSDAYNFCMMNFYRGLIFLSYKDFLKSSACFLSVFKVAFTSINFFTHFHIESMKRLVLISFLVDPIYRNYIKQVISENKNLLTIKGNDIYSKLYQKFGNVKCYLLMLQKSVAINEIEKLVAENIIYFKADRTYGLIKLCVKEIIFDKISDVLKSYRRIRLDKLSKLIDIEKKQLISHLKYFTEVNYCIKFNYFLFQNQKLNVRFEEIEEIITVLNHSFEETKSLNEMKFIYENVKLIFN